MKSSPSNLELALGRLREIVGSEYVNTSDQELAYRSTCTTPWTNACAAVVYPASTEEIIKITQVARDFELTLWPVSKGKNWGYGSSVASHAGAIILVLERMNRILEVHEELAYAVIEPGVTYRQLNQYLKDHRIKLWADCTDGPPEGSVLGSALERGVGETPYCDHFANLCGLEVILPDGERVQTGGGALDALKTRHTYKWGVGPYLEGIFSQSNMGIVTKAGLWLMPEPECVAPFIFDLHDASDFPALVDQLRELVMHGVLGTKLHVVNDVVSTMLVTQFHEHALAEQTFLPEARLAEMRQLHGIAPWSFVAALYGTKGQISANKKILNQALREYGSIQFISDTKVKLIERFLPALKRSRSSPLGKFVVDRVLRSIAGKSLEMIEAAPHIHGLLRGVPSEFFVRHAYFKTGKEKPLSQIDEVKDGCGLIWFAPIVPFTSYHVMELLDACKPQFHAAGFDCYVALLQVNARSLVPLMAIVYSKADADETARATLLYHDLVTLITSLNYQEYRSAIGRWEHVFDAAPGILALNKKIKQALDPANLLAPDAMESDATQTIYLKGRTSEISLGKIRTKRLLKWLGGNLGVTRSRPHDWSDYGYDGRAGYMATEHTA